MTMAQHTNLYTIASGLCCFAAWTVSSFLAHYAARMTIESNNEEKMTEKWITVLVLTTVQLLVGGAVLKLIRYIVSRNCRWTASCSQETKGSCAKDALSTTENVEGCRISLYMCHAFASLATNASIAFVNPGSAFTIKAFEPITSAVLTSVLLGIKLQAHAVVSLPLVVAGAVGFVWRPSLTAVALYGLSMAFVSNILFGVRNINLKLLQRDATSTLSKLALLETASLMAAAILTTAAIILTILTSLPSSFNLLTSLVSALFHVTYTVVSTCLILNYTSVVGHATLNLLKRILVAVTFYLIGQTVVSSSNWLMAAVMLVGLLLYAFPNACHTKGTNASLSLVVVTTMVVVIMSVVSPLTSPSLIDVHNVDSRIQLPQLPLEDTMKERQQWLDKSAFPVEAASLQQMKAYEDPKNINHRSNKATDTNSLIKEAYDIHEQVFGRILGKYKKAVLVNVFQWFNKGDHLITIGQRKILHRMGINLTYHCFYPGRNCDFSGIDKSDPQLVILIQGAGYIGHPSHEFVTTITVESFPNNRVMVFPISVCHPIAPCTEIQQFADIFAKHDDVHIVLRDRYSFDLAQQYFKNTKNYLAPDSAFAVGSIRMNIVPVHDIVWLKRDDWESQNDPLPEFPKGLNVQVTDWSDEWMNQKADDFWEDHQLRTMTGISFLARAKVVISDRLHAHIMSQLMGKLNVVINSETKKQEHYYMTWEQSVKTCVLVNNNADALKEALKLLQQYDESVSLV